MATKMYSLMLFLGVLVLLSTGSLAQLKPPQGQLPPVIPPPGGKPPNSLEESSLEEKTLAFGAKLPKGPKPPSKFIPPTPINHESLDQGKKPYPEHKLLINPVDQKPPKGEPKSRREHYQRHPPAKDGRNRP
ncbi:early nodulin-75-like [Juglans microcarpa x Juglans regia]|uniref:early nodulin-75-like n=1 Tax=Juglans microcarpa x Juglans regia TaxID=2249226 RepID=UPI001B7F787A|nr:early nodulin-75-like [Juglans microcarpa x Juglans regia]